MDDRKKTVPRFRTRAAVAVALLATVIALPALAAGPVVHRSVAASTTADATNASTTITPSDQAHAKATADATVSFWKLAWDKTAPFFRSIAVGFWDLLVRAWHIVTGRGSAPATNAGTNTNAAANGSAAAPKNNASITPIPGPLLS